MADFEKYYDEELRYLKEGGEEFAEAFPERARYLNLNALDDRDPYVERLFEGFAFLSGRVRQKLDDDFPEFTRNLMEMVDPIFLRPIPSIAMLQIGFSENLLNRQYVVKRGTLFLSQPVGPSQTLCRFQSSRDVTVRPMTLLAASLIHHTQLGDGVEMHFSFDASAEVQHMDMDNVDMQVHGERAFAWWLHGFLTQKVSQVFLEADGKSIALGGQECVQPGGFEGEEALLPGNDSSFEGSRFLLEWLCCEEKFRYINLKGLNRIQNLGKPKKFSLRIHFNEAIPEGRRLRAENLRLHTTPVVNLYEARAEPISLNHKHFEYLAMPDSGPSAEIFEVQDVMGIDKATGKRQTYHRFHAFRHIAMNAGENMNGGWYQIRTEREGKGGTRTWLSLGREGSVERWEEEYLSIGILATDGNVPREHVLENSLKNPAAGFPTFLHFTNYTRPSVPIAAPRSQHYLWYVLSHLNLGMRSLCEDGILKEALSLYDWSRSAVNRKMLDGFTGVESKRRAFLIAGQLAHGTEIKVTLREEAIAEEGERMGFARVLLHFLTQYASINHLVSLTLQLTPSGKTVSLSPLEGRCPSI